MVGAADRAGHRGVGARRRVEPGRRRPRASTSRSCGSASGHSDPSTRRRCALVTIGAGRELGRRRRGADRAGFRRVRAAVRHPRLGRRHPHPERRRVRHRDRRGADRRHRVRPGGRSRPDTAGRRARPWLPEFDPARHRPGGGHATSRSGCTARPVTVRYAELARALGVAGRRRGTARRGAGRRARPAREEGHGAGPGRSGHLQRRLVLHQSHPGQGSGLRRSTRRSRPGSARRPAIRPIRSPARTVRPILPVGSSSPLRG